MRAQRFETGVGGYCRPPVPWRRAKRATALLVVCRRAADRSLPPPGFITSQVDRMAWFDVSEALVDTTFLPSPRAGHSLTLVPEKGVAALFGGASHEEGPQNDLVLFELATKRWIRPPQLLSKPPPRYEHAACLVHRRGIPTLLVFGGSDGEQVLNDLWAFNFESFSWSLLEARGTAPRPRTLHSMGAIASHSDSSRIYVFGGGQSGSAAVDDAEMYCLDVESLLWVRLTNPGVGPRPLPRQGHSVIACGSSIYIFGGLNGDVSFGDLWAFDVGRRTWRAIAPDVTGTWPLARSAHSATLVGRRIYVIGGMNRHHDPMVLGDIYSFDTETEAWSREPSEGSSRRLDHAACYWSPAGGSIGRASDTGLQLIPMDAVPSGILVFGGMNLDGLFNDLRVYVI
ncbi:uncharacterized protein BJ171DRAFT_600694 [Polychytrium aggregatum]|uniref:uncharacterized protein n=1 Tax=Polychytrium aggregatum TaxID=110093 RepID=UPI0022FF2BD1|nr:uncharacterized protein BJ171DRAFT_600694 [Polychytrium aggregatum]KAI9202682.1 hypothetical protein BJ171DRAFT_600694 [Polychytrium aggregatum]